MRLISLSAIAAMFVAGAAWAHPATEQFVPIGESPGPGVVQGRAGAVAEPASGPPLVLVEDGEGEDVGAYIVTPTTRVYIDRSEQGLPSLVGTLDDVQPGRVIEVRVRDPETRAAEWIKVRP